MTTADFMRFTRAQQTFEREPLPLPVIGHMPFIGHRNQQTVRLVEQAALKRWGAETRAAAYGYETRPDA